MRRPRAFTTLDAVLALSLTAVMAAVLTRAASDQRRAATAGARVRHAVEVLEEAAARLRAGEPLGGSVAAEPAAPGWLRLTPADADTPELLIADPEALP